MRRWSKDVVRPKAAPKSDRGGRKPKPAVKPCRALGLAEARVLLLVRSEWQTFDELQAQAAGMARYELKGHLGVLGVLSLVELNGRQYRHRASPRTDEVMTSARAMLEGLQP